MMDYAVQRDWGWDTSTNQWTGAQVNGKDPVDLINNDVRTLKVELRTTLTSGQTRTDYLTVSQYNTITVNYKNGSGTAVCGFSRVDVGDQFNKQARDVIEPDEKFLTSNSGLKSTIWGYHINTVSSSVYSNMNGTGSLINGAENMKDIGAYFLEYNWSDAWSGSAMQKSQHTFVSVNNGTIVRVQVTTTKDSRTDQCWYLPAKVELEGFLTAYMKSGFTIHTNLANYNDSYWSSSLVGTTNAYALVVQKSTNYGFDYFVNTLNINRGEGVPDSPGEPYSKYYIRQARRF